MILNDNYIFYDASDLKIPKIYLLNCLNNDTIILHGESYELFKQALTSTDEATKKMAYKTFKEFGLFAWE